ncbi:hypothetical protein KI387_036489 [Taxus chinensis]|uniref:BTB domain-containing protein n=1 Tax=Taxus chinensis TaxID=29808 RepID=A0AA38FTT0_TAXCH|nr:hypothetical protein KI387_036489 [Taxus chinensis]
MQGGRSKRRGGGASAARKKDEEDEALGQGEGPSHHLQDRLHKALTLGLRYKDGKTKKWWNNDAEVQGQAIRAISTFVAALTSNFSRQPSVQALLSEVMIALQGLLQSENEHICSVSSEIVVKLTALLGGSLLKFGGEELVAPLAQLLSCHETTTAMACAASLNNILEKIKPRSTFSGKSASGDTVWKVIQETNTVYVLVQRLEKYDSNETKSAEYYLEFSNLLGKILRWFPMSRYIVGNNRNLRLGLLAQSRNHNALTASAALQTSSALALCGEVAIKQIGDKDALWTAILQCLDESRPRVVRVEAFRFVQSLARSATGCDAMSGPHVGPLMSGIVKTLAEWRTPLQGRWQPELEMLVIEACHTANRLLCWSGEHHFVFWKAGISNVLSGMLLFDHSDDQQWSNKMIDTCKEKQVNGVIDKLHIKKNSAIRPHLWDSLGWLAIHCEMDLDSMLSINKNPLLRLISFACKMSVKAVYRQGQLHVQRETGNRSTQDVPDISEREPICRAVLFLLFSPCKYLASQTRLFLEKALKPYGHEWMQSLLCSIDLGACDNGHSISDNLQMIVSLMTLVSFSSLQLHRKILYSYNALEILGRVIKSQSNSDIQVARSNISNHVVSLSDGKLCCWNETEDWEGKNLILFFSLWAFAKLVKDSVFAGNARQEGFVEDFTNKVITEETEVRVLIRQLQKLVVGNSFSAGVRWYAAHSMAGFGIYGFPSKLGGNIKKAFDNDEMADLLLALSDGRSLNTHLVILAARCPSLLPSSNLILNQNKGSLGGDLLKEKALEKMQQKVNAMIHYGALRNSLEFAYTGTVQVDEENVAGVRFLAKRCNLESLLSLLSGKTPNWGTSVLEYNIASALSAIGHPYSDAILQAKGQKYSTTSCSVCTLLTEHVHVHRIVLASNSDYLRALFRSGMRDSSEVIQVPVGWEALRNLVKFFYTGQMNSFKSGCLWNNMDPEQQLKDLQAFIELSWLAAQWFIDDVSDVCLSVLHDKLKLNLHLCPKIIQKAAHYSQWAIVEEGVECMAPRYPWMRDRFELEELDDELVEMVRVAHVRLSQDDR